MDPSPKTDGMHDKLPAETEDNNIEYKLWLRRDRMRIEGLKSQMNYRLMTGEGLATYWIGVMDDGTKIGIGSDVLNDSIDVLTLVATELGARVDVITRLVVVDKPPGRLHKRLNKIVPSHGCREVARIKISREKCEMPPIFI